MKTRIYLVKKDSDQIGEHNDWIQMTGAEFTAFRRSPEGRTGPSLLPAKAVSWQGKPFAGCTSDRECDTGGLCRFK